MPGLPPQNPPRVLDSRGEAGDLGGRVVGRGAGNFLGNNWRRSRIYTNVTIRGGLVGASGLKKQCNPEWF